jgi:hypothetical protein
MTNDFAVLPSGSDALLATVLTPFVVLTAHLVRTPDALPKLYQYIPAPGGPKRDIRISVA